MRFQSSLLLLRNPDVQSHVWGTRRVKLKNWGCSVAQVGRHRCTRVAKRRDIAKRAEVRFARTKPALRSFGVPIQRGDDASFFWLRHPGSPKTDNRGYPKHIQVTNATSGPLNLDDRDFRFAGKSRLLEVNSVDDIEVVIRCVPLSVNSFEESANTDIRVTRLIAIAFG